MRGEEVIDLEFVRLAEVGVALEVGAVLVGAHDLLCERLGDAVPVSPDHNKSEDVRRTMPRNSPSSMDAEAGLKVALPDLKFPRTNDGRAYFTFLLLSGLSSTLTDCNTL